MPVKRIILTEHEEAKLFAEFLNVLQTTGRINLYSHIANGAFTRNWGTKTKNKQEGVRKGVPDYIIVTERFVLFVELKRLKGSKIYIEQQQWVDGLQGKTSKAFIAKGFDQAVEFITNNL